MSASPTTVASPPILFQAHGTFFTKAVVEGASSYSHAQMQSQPLSLPAGRYRLIADYHLAFGGSGADIASMALLDPDGSDSLHQSFSEITEGHAGRVTKVVTLTAPFKGLISYGGGAFDPEEMWFAIAPADATGFVPFGFGRTPIPLKKGAENAARGTLNDEIGDFYYLHLPAGTWSVRLALTTVSDGAAVSGQPSTQFGAAVELLDEQGMQVPQTNQTGPTAPFRSLSVPFYNPGENQSELQQVFKTDVAAFIKLHVYPYAGTQYSHVVPLTYILTLKPAPPVDTKQP